MYVRTAMHLKLSIYQARSWGGGAVPPPLGNKIEIMPPPLIPHFLPFKKNRQRGCHIQANKVNKGVA
jgi:hypothetical protein